ncbi:MAG: DUF5082 domain-containing protein [Anaerolineae bacterium]|nr:DUF5082 domain-containing protein [Anaerolineae bacterium]
MKLGRFLLILASVLLVLVTPTLAHEGREVGEHVIEFGWRVEPALAGQMNGPELTITHHDGGEPFEGAEATLRLEVSLGDQTMTLPLRPGNEPGHYIADLIPTRPGDYSFHLTGTIDEVSVDEMFTSADGEFSTVEPAGDVMFPQMDAADVASLQAQIAELQAQIADLQAQIEELKAQ